jgi:hypothetical protein
LANIMLDPLDHELEKRGLRFARYADDFLVLVKSAPAARRVMSSIIRVVEARLGLVVNRQKSQAGPLTRCTFLGFAFRRKQMVWSDKALGRFQERIRENTSRRRDVHMSRRLEELRRYAVGWLNNSWDQSHRVASASVREAKLGSGYGRHRHLTGTDPCLEPDFLRRTSSNWKDNSPSGADPDVIGVGFLRRFGRRRWNWRAPTG